MFDIKFKKGLEYENNYIRIYDDTMYVTEHTKKILEEKYGNKHGHIKIASLDRYQYTLTLRQRKHHSSDKLFILHMSCGDSCYPNYYRNKNFTIGVRIRRFLMKQLINKCKNTEMGRGYRLAKLLNMDDGVSCSNN